MRSIEVQEISAAAELRLTLNSNFPLGGKKLDWAST